MHGLDKSRPWAPTEALGTRRYETIILLPICNSLPTYYQRAGVYAIFVRLAHADRNERARAQSGPLSDCGRQNFASVCARPLGPIARSSIRNREPAALAEKLRPRGYIFSLSVRVAIGLGLQVAGIVDSGSLPLAAASAIASNHPRSDGGSRSHRTPTGILSFIIAGHR